MYWREQRAYARELAAVRLAEAAERREFAAADRAASAADRAKLRAIRLEEAAVRLAQSRSQSGSDGSGASKSSSVAQVMVAAQAAAGRIGADVTPGVHLITGASGTGKTTLAVAELRKMADWASRTFFVTSRPLGAATSGCGLHKYPDACSPWLMAGVTDAEGSAAVVLPITAAKGQRFPLGAVVAIDEVQLVPREALRHLLDRAVNATVILVGDDAQAPYGQAPLLDLIRLVAPGAAHTHLTERHGRTTPFVRDLVPAGSERERILAELVTDEELEALRLWPSTCCGSQPCGHMVDGAFTCAVDPSVPLCMAELLDASPPRPAGEVLCGQGVSLKQVVADPRGSHSALVWARQREGDAAGCGVIRKSFPRGVAGDGHVVATGYGSQDFADACRREITADAARRMAEGARRMDERAALRPWPPRP